MNALASLISERLAGDQRRLTVFLHDELSPETALRLVQHVGELAEFVLVDDGHIVKVVVRAELADEAARRMVAIVTTGRELASNTDSAAPMVPRDPGEVLH